MAMNARRTGTQWLSGEGKAGSGTGSGGIEDMDWDKGRQELLEFWKWADEWMNCIESFRIGFADGATFESYALNLSIVRLGGLRVAQDKRGGIIIVWNDPCP